MAKGPRIHSRMGALEVWDVVGKDGLAVNMSGLVVDVGVGGTFTDLVIFDPANGNVRLAKVPTTLDPALGGQAAGVLQR